MVNWRCLGIDISAKQLEMARSGAKELAVSDRVEYREQLTAALGFETMVTNLVTTTCSTNMAWPNFEWIERINMASSNVTPKCFEIVIFRRSFW